MATAHCSRACVSFITGSLAARWTHHTENGLHSNNTGPAEGAHGGGQDDNQPHRPDRCLGVRVEPSEQSSIGQTSISTAGIM